jgi:iron(III) transport system permease protein
VSTVARPARRRPKALEIVGLVVAVAFVALVLYPLGSMLVNTFFPNWTIDLSAFASLAADKSLLATIGSTVLVVVVSGCLALVIGSVFAWLVERTDLRLGWAGRILPIVPLLIPPVALSVGWEFLASTKAGLLNVLIRNILDLVGIHLTSGPLDIDSWSGLIFVYTVYLVPFAFLAVGGALRNLDVALEEASRTSGAGLGRTLRSVVLPSLAPTFAGAAVLLAIFGFSVYSIPAIIGASAQIPILSVDVVRMTQVYPPQLGEAAIVGIGVLIVIGGLSLLQRRLAGRQRHATVSGRASGTSLVRLRGWRNPLRVVIWLYLILTSVLPFLALLLVALQPYWTPKIDLTDLTLNNFIHLLSGGTQSAFQALGNSVVLGIVGATLCLVVAIMLVVIPRERGGFGSGFIETTAKIPGAIPHVVIAVAFIIALTGPPFRLYGTLAILLLGYLVLFMPQASITIASAYDQIGADLREASRVSGASQLKTLLRVTAPLMRSSIVAGWALLFVLISGELTASIMLATTATPVVGYLIVNTWENGTYSELAALGCIMSVMSAVIVGIVMLRGSRSAAQSAQFVR